MREKSTIIWLAGVLSHHRKRVRDTTHQSRLSGCKYLCIFPNSENDRLLLVGTDSVDTNGDNFWKVIALQSPGQSLNHAINYLNHPVSTLPNDIPREDEENGDIPPLPLLHIQTLRDFISRLVKLAQDTVDNPDAINAARCPAPPSELLQYFARQMRILTDSRFAQLRWKPLRNAATPIPYALAQRNLTECSTQVIDTTIELTSSTWNHDDQFEIIHQYLITVGEKLWVSDFSQWIGEHSPDLGAGSMSSDLEPDTKQFRWWSVIGMPLYYRGEIVGTLIIVDNRQEKLFSQNDIALIELLVPLIEVAIEIACIQSELEDRRMAQYQSDSQLIRSARLAALGEMAAGVAHELNNPLTTVTGFVELVLNELPADSSMHTDLELALSEALRARGIVRGLLDFSRPSQEVRLPTDVNDLISQVLNLIRHLIRINNLSVRLELRDDLPLVVIDPNKILQVLLNLVQNAIRAMPSGGTLTIHTDLPKELPMYSSGQNNKWLCVSIQDTGIGIPAQALGKIFEPFFTLPDNNSSEEPGVGLGLPVSLQIVQGHGGTIEVESTLHQGSKFTVFLPLTEL